MRLALTIPLALLLAWGCTPKGIGVFIRLDRPYKIGERYQLQVSAAHRDQTTLTGKEGPRVNANTYTILLEGTLTVRSIDSRGRLTGCDFLCERLDKILPDKTETLLGRATPIAASVTNGVDAYTVDRKAPSPEVQAALAMVLSMSKGGATDDEIYGAWLPKRPGSQWAVHAVRVASELKLSGMKAEKKDASGICTFTGVLRLSNIDCIRIERETRVTNARPDLAPGTSLLKSIVETKGSVTLPLGASRQALEEEDQVRLHLVARARAPKAPEKAATPPAGPAANPAVAGPAAAPEKPEAAEDELLIEWASMTHFILKRRALTP
jgi:hypothetical protein